MDRNEVLLVGRLSAAVEEHPMPSGDTVTKWRIIVRRRRPHRRGGTITDSVPCVTFNREAAAVLRRLKPRDYVEVTGAFRCRVFGPAGAKIWKYEVEVSTAKPIDATTLSEPVCALPLAAPEDLVARSEPVDAAAPSGAVDAGASAEPVDTAALSAAEEHSPAMTTALVPRQVAPLARAS